MRFYYDLDLGQLVQTPGYPNAVNRVDFKRGDAAEIRLGFYQGGRQVSIGSGALLRFALKPSEKYDSDAVVFSDSWTYEDDNTPEYYCNPSFNTVELNALFNHVDGDLDNDLPSVDLMFEITWSVDNEVTWTSTDTISARVFNDVIKGVEGVPTSGSPMYPAASEVINLTSNITVTEPINLDNLEGIAGPAGADGADGADSTVPGPIGPAGADGADSTVPGPAGADGADGADNATLDSVTTNGATTLNDISVGRIATLHPTNTVNNNVATGNQACAIGGVANQVSGNRSVNYGGRENQVTGNDSSTIGGFGQIVIGQESEGFGSTATTLNTKYTSAIGTINSVVGLATEGTSSTVTQHSSVLGGDTNIIQSATEAVIVGGTTNTIQTGHHRSVVLGGTGITTDAADTAYVPNLNVGAGFKMPTGATDTYVLTSDANGVGTWQAGGGGGGGSSVVASYVDNSFTITKPTSADVITPVSGLSYQMTSGTTYYIKVFVLSETAIGFDTEYIYLSHTPWANTAGVKEGIVGTHWNDEGLGTDGGYQSGRTQYAGSWYEQSSIKASCFKLLTIRRVLTNRRLYYSTINCNFHTNNKLPGNSNRINRC